MAVLHNFDEWKKFLADRVSQAEGLGMDENTIHDLAYEIGDYLAQDVDPKNEQQRVLKELWDVADENQQRVIAELMVKIVDKK